MTHFYIWGDYCPLYCCIIYTYFLNELFSKKVSVYHWQEREHFVRNKAIFSQFNCRDPLRTILRSRCTIGDDTILHLPLNPLPLRKDVWLGILRETYVKVNSFTHHLNRWLECIGHTQVKMHSCPNVFVCSMVGEMRSWKRPASVFAPLEGNSLPLSSHICFIGKEKLLSIVPLQWYARVRKLHFPLKRVAGFNNCIASIYPSDLNIYSGYHKALSPVPSQWSIAYPSHEWNVVEVRCCWESRAWSFRFLFPSFQFSPASKLVQLWIIRASGDFGCGFSGFAFVTRWSLWAVLGWY